MRYDWILFDADETLFSFNSYEGLKPLLKRYGIDFTPADYEAFQAVNKPLWVAYQNKEITAEQLRDIRFRQLAEQTGESTENLNLGLMNEMAKVSKPLPNVMTMLNALHGKAKMAIITNGFHSLQDKRLKNTETLHFFEFVTCSQDVGVAKPDPQIFEACFAKMGAVEKSKVLMVGDTLASDIVGGQNVGVDTCWFNHTGQANSGNIRPTYEITNILSLIDIVQG